ncbi:MAG: DUF2336 domain-containing protein, partial [Oceanicaulis sp.]
LRARLSRDDVERLVDQKDPDQRAIAARKFCARYASPELSEAERAIGAEIVRVLARDAAEMVRRALADTLQRSPHLPADVARRLIADVDTVAVPVIAGSPVLEDADLIALIGEAAVSRQVAVASRSTVSEAVVQVIAERGAPEAVSTAAANDGARFDETSYDAAIRRFSADPSILERFVERSHLPLSVTEKLIAKISDAAIDRLVQRHALPPSLAVELAEGARERATVDLVDQAGLSPDPRRFVQQLQMSARLTPSLMLRALFRGHMTFFEHCVAELAAVDYAKAWLLIHDAGPLGLEAVFRKAGLPERVLPAVKAAVDSWRSLEIGAGGARDVVIFRQRLAERIFTQFQNAPESELDYLMDRLDMDVRALEQDRRGAA